MLHLFLCSQSPLLQDSASRRRTVLDSQDVEVNMARATLEPVTHVLSTAKILGDKVVNRAGENLGKLEELMLDLDNGRVAYAVLSFGGFLGMGDKHFALPFEALKLDAAHECFI